MTPKPGAGIGCGKSERRFRMSNAQWVSIKERQPAPGQGCWQRMELSFVKHLYTKTGTGCACIMRCGAVSLSQRSRTGCRCLYRLRRRVRADEQPGKIPSWPVQVWLCHRRCQGVSADDKAVLHGRDLPRRTCRIKAWACHSGHGDGATSP